MKIVREIKKGSAVILAFALLLSGAVLSEVQAALEIDTNKKGSVTFQLDGDLDGDFEELKELEIPVKLYQVAEVDTSGAYKALTGFEDLKLEEITSETTAAEWEEKAKLASGIIDEKEDAKEDKSCTITGGTGKVEELSVGMYLVKADTVLSPEYEYSFTPYLISVPNNYWATSGDDTWVYDVTTGLKPGRENRLGSLVINKTLTSFNSTLGPASFVFQVEGEKDYEQVYSNVVSVVFDGTGTKSIQIDDLPAGATFTVTEIYSGASYKLTTEPFQTAKIIAEGEEGSPVSVSFTNTYDERMNGGASIVNHFTNTDGVWDWQQQTDSTVTVE